MVSICTALPQGLSEGEGLTKVCEHLEDKRLREAEGGVLPLSTKPCTCHSRASGLGRDPPPAASGLGQAQVCGPGGQVQAAGLATVAHSRGTWDTSVALGSRPALPRCTSSRVMSC